MVHAQRQFGYAIGLGILILGSGCAANTEVSRLMKENQELRAERDRLARALTEQEGVKAQLEQQVVTLAGFSPERPLHKFAAVKLEIASLSGGADYDGKPGDDGVTLYLRPRDSEGDVVKTPGRIKVQLVDNSDLASPRVLAVCTFDDLEKVKDLWSGKFGTQHYSVRCPFPPGENLPASRKLTAAAEFVDITTGATLTAVQEVAFAMPPP